MNTEKSPYHGYRFPAEIISHSVWLYYRFWLSFRDVEDLLLRGDPLRDKQANINQLALL